MKIIKRLRIPGIFLAGAIAAAAPAVIYYNHFKDLPISTSGQEWAWLGSYLSGTTGPILTAINICLTLYALYLVNHFRLRESTAFDLHKEWNGEKMYESRMKADEFLDEHPADSLANLYAEKIAGIGHVWIVMAFFQRIQVSAEMNRIPDKLLESLFGQIFTWWYVVCFQFDLPNHWDGTPRIRNLYERVSKFKDFETWRTSAEATLLEKVEKKNKPQQLTSTN